MGIYEDRWERGPARAQFAGGFMLLVVIWLIVGAVAAGQRHYYDSTPTNCASAGTIAVTILAGPLNYAGVNPKIHECNVPQPSP